MGMPFDDDDEDEKDGILGQLGNEVDDYAGSQIPGGGKGVTISINVQPNGQAQVSSGGGEDHESPMGGEGSLDDHGGGDDAMAHILGMCGGGCAMCKGGMA